MSVGHLCVFLGEVSIINHLFKGPSIPKQSRSKVLGLGLEHVHLGKDVMQL